MGVNNAGAVAGANMLAKLIDTGTMPRGAAMPKWKRASPR